MNYAIDIATNRELHADSAKPRRGYRCPVCKGAVYLKRAGVYVAHFVHYHHTASPDCENYHPGSIAYAPTEERQRNQALAYRQVAILLQIDEDSAGSMGWRLKLLVPKPIIWGAYFEVQVGHGDNRRLSIGGNETSHLFDLIPSHDEVGVMGFIGSVPQSIVDNIEPKTDKLETDLISVFSDTSTGRKPRSHYLRIGGRYFFLWTGLYPARIHEELDPHHLASRHGWNCALVTIPETSSEALIHWLRLYTGLSTGADRGSVQILFPFGGWRNRYGEIELDRDEQDVLVSIRAQPIASGEERTLEIDDDETRTLTKLPVSGDALIMVTRVTNQPRVTIALEEDAPSSYAFTRSDINQVQVACVWIEVSGQDGRTEASPLHQRLAHSLLKAVRDGKRALLGINIPPGVKGVLLQFDQYSDSPTKHLYGNKVDDEDKGLASQFAEQVSAALLNPEVLVALDFGAFGRQTIAATPRPAVRRESAAEGSQTALMARCSGRSKSARRTPLLSSVVKRGR